MLVSSLTLSGTLLWINSTVHLSVKYCVHLFTCDCDQYMTRSQGKACFVSQFEGAVYHGGVNMATRGSMCQESGLGFSFLHILIEQDAERRTKVWPGAKSSHLAPTNALPPKEPHFFSGSPTSSRGASLPPEEPYFLKVPQSSKTLSPAGNQMLKQVSPLGAGVGHFIFKL